MQPIIIDSDYNWKSAASQEGVDYDAVRKSFMDQAYGLVSNKAKVLFQDPFRLGFEVVHRNEKATKMTGFFAFRVNGAILYAPVFFLNGEIKAADMLYRGDVKRFVPLTDEWCAFLVRGANQEAGQLSDKSRQKQPDSNMSRLAYPQRVKYAGAEMQVKKAAELLEELMAHCADDSEPRALLPLFLSEAGPESLAKLASLIEDSDTAKRHVATHYTSDELMNLDGWLAKQARSEPVDPELNAVVLVTDLRCVKSAAEHGDVARRGYSLVDNRPTGATSVVDEVDPTTIHEITGTGLFDVMTADGSTEAMLVGNHTSSYSFFSSASQSDELSSGYCARELYHIDKKQYISPNGSPIFGNQRVSATDPADLGKSLGDLSTGDTVILFRPGSVAMVGPFKVLSTKADGEAKVITFGGQSGYSERPVTYAPGRTSSGSFAGDDVRALPVTVKARAGGFEPVWDTVLMSPQGIDKWLRTAGGLTSSVDVTITCKDAERGVFDITHKGMDDTTKCARDLGMLEAHLMLANDFEMRCDTAGKLLDKAIDDTVTRVRVFDTQSKSAFMTRSESMRPWVTSTDPELNVRVDTPQRQVLNTYTPKRPSQTQRYGDHWERGAPSIPRTEDEDGLPEDALLTRSPEELAQMAAQYQMPQIFDHGVLSQLAKSNFNTLAQVQQYVPDLETGVDRFFRILFLLRYRPADFEEAYGRDEMMEMEQEVSELAAMAGENLLRLLKRFDAGKFSRQGG